MILQLLIACAAVGAAGSAWGLARTGRAARLGLLAGVLALLLVTILAFAMDAPRIADGGDAAAGAPFNGWLVPNAYMRLVVGLWALMSVLVIGIAGLLGGRRALRGLLPATLAAIAGGSVALGAADLGLGVAAATATGLAALVTVLAQEGPAAVSAAASELRVILAGGAILLATVAVVPLVAGLVLRDVTGGTGDGTGAGSSGEAGAAMGLLILAVTLAIGLRYGVLPFHLRVPRLADVVHPASLPLLLAWIPLPLAVVGIAAVDALVAPLALPLDGERLIIVLFALLTLAGAALGAYLQDDLRHAMGYLVVADAGLLILAVAALDPAAWGPTRAWIVILAASKTALGAWTAVTEDRFETRSIPDLRGWMRRSPLLAAGLVLVVAATFGLPGWLALEARGTLASLVVEGPAAAVLVLAGFLTLPTYVRLLVLGAGSVTSRVDGSVPERIVRRPRGRRAESLPVEQEGEPAPAMADTTIEMAPSRRAARSAAPTVARLVAAVRRDRAELLSGAVLALAILAALTSWGALDIGGAAAEPAPIVIAPGSD